MSVQKNAFIIYKSDPTEICNSHKGNAQRLRKAATPLAECSRQILEHCNASKAGSTEHRSLKAIAFCQRVSLGKESLVLSATHHLMGPNRKEHWGKYKTMRVFQINNTSKKSAMV